MAKTVIVNHRFSCLLYRTYLYGPYKIQTRETSPRRLGATQQVLKMESGKHHHFVLVHGLGQGAWCWYKLRTLLEALGHQVTALDLVASGVNLKKLSEVDTMLEYSQPLMEFMEKISTDEERVILVGHSLGGMSLAYAMEKFPKKVSVGVFLTALMPDTSHNPAYVMDKLFELLPIEEYMDSQFSLEEGREKTKTTVLFGLDFMSSMFLQLSPAEDLVLATMLRRVGSTFYEDLSAAVNFSDEGYGSVNRAYIVCKGDKGFTEEFQRWMIQNYPGAEVKEIQGADHFAMLSKPQEVSHALLELAHKYA